MPRGHPTTTGDMLIIHVAYLHLGSNLGSEAEHFAGVAAEAGSAGQCPKYSGGDRGRGSVKSSLLHTASSRSACSETELKGEGR